MANNCFFEMHVSGRKRNLNKFFHYMDYKHQKEGEKYFPRTFPSDKTEYITYNGNHVISIVGDCAWSIYSCLCKGAHTCFGEKNKNKTMHNMIDMSKYHKLEIEVWSEEHGIGFSEHYYIKNDEIIINDCEDLMEEYNEKTGEFEYTKKADNFWSFDYV